MFVDLKPRERIRLDNRIMLTVLEVIDDQIIFSLENLEDPTERKPPLCWNNNFSLVEPLLRNRLEPPSLS